MKHISASLPLRTLCATVLALGIGATAVAESNTYVATFKTDAGAPVGASLPFTVNVPTPVTGQSGIPFTVSFAGTPTYTYSGTVTAIASSSAHASGDGLCIQVNKAQECVAWADGAPCPDAANPLCDKWVGEGTGDSRLTSILSRALAPTPPATGTLVIDSQGWRITGTAPPGLTATSGKLFFFNEASVPEPPVALLLLGGVGGLLAFRARQRAKGASRG